MIVTVLWEDCRGVVRKGFGAHELLVACVAEELHSARRDIARVIQSLPKKGAGNVIAELRGRLHLLANRGPVFAVLDLDKAREIWKPRVAACKAAIRDRIKMEVSGSYELVLLERNMESLVDVCDPSARKRLGDKPNPDARDRILEKASSTSPAMPRATVLANCPSFSRLVKRVAAKLLHMGPPASR
jgi:hypothetical protein